MTWWSNQDVDPKRKNRFKFYIDEVFIPTVVSVTKPSVQIDSKEYQMVNQVYSYPGIAKWNPITVTFIDAGGDAQDEYRAANSLLQYIKSAGYSAPAYIGEDIGTSNGLSPSKSDFSNTLGDIRIVHVDGDGNELENWQLYNPIITRISWGDLDYGDDGIVQYSMDIKYDFANFED